LDDGFLDVGSFAVFEAATAGGFFALDTGDFEREGFGFGAGGFAVVLHCLQLLNLHIILIIGLLDMHTIIR